MKTVLCGLFGIIVGGALSLLLLIFIKKITGYSGDALSGMLGYLFGTVFTAFALIKFGD